jgi:hypothetical protein
MRARTPLLALTIAAALLALAPVATAATPFTAGTGSGQDVAVGSDGTGHVVWVTDETADRVGYCRIPAGGTACDSESGFLTFPIGTSPSSPSPHAQVFTPAPGKVVILASCTNCTGIAQKTYRFISTNNGVSFSAGTQVGNLALNGQADYINTGDVALSVEASDFQAQVGPSPGPTTQLALGQSPLYVYDASVAVDPGGTRAVYAVNNLNAVGYRVFQDPSTPGITAAELNNSANWSASLLSLTSPEADNTETHVDGGPSGLYLTYLSNQPGDARVGLRKFDTGTNSFSSPAYIQGADPIEDSGIAYTNHSQDASGRIHAVWRALYDDGRLRYTRSDTSGGNFSAPANLAVRETFFDPVVEAGSDGNGFAVWRGSASSIRVVPIDPQPEPAGPGGPGGPGGTDTTPPTTGGFDIGDSTLTPGQGTGFTFDTSENGVATLTVQKQVKGLKVRVRGKRRCVPQTRKRLRALRRQAGSRAAFRRLLRKRRCTAYKRIGSITQRVTAGSNTIYFSGRIAGRRLRPGRYRALLKITDLAGNVSRVERVRFRVLRRRR